VPNVPGAPLERSSAEAPGRYGVPSSKTPTSSIASPSRSGISRKAPLKLPENANVMFSSTTSEPSGWTRTTTSAAGSEKDWADAAPASASAAESAAPSART